ncbi:hypothetical protein [Bifidobacterium subtile]|uniref:hypothetical protein n=1 Tax=Bifidobacterium subtile TaxID=77635 RepID=UPI002F359B9A
MPKLFYKPDKGWVGDVIPYCENGIFYLFYLCSRRDAPEEGTDWNLVTTRDFVHFDEHGPQHIRGDEQSPDFNAYTGSVVKDESGNYHLFYTGQNPRYCNDVGAPLQIVMHAVSKDGMQSWQKIPTDAFGAPQEYQTSDWRDPFVFWDEQEGIWHLILAARKKSGVDRRQGVVAQYTSTNLHDWNLSEPLWQPDRYITQECPDVFFWNGWWYLVYSEFSDSFVTRYRMSRSLKGPWLAPACGRDSIDGRAFYAAKTASHNGRRFLFGWIASREDANDDGAWQWAGTLSILEVVQHENGSLAFSIPDEVLKAFTQKVWGLPDDHAFTVGRSDGYASRMVAADVPNSSHVRISFEISANKADAGIILRAGEDGNCGHIIRFEPKRNRFVWDRWPRKQTGTEQWQISGDVPYAVELERPCALGPGLHKCDIVMEDDICVVDVDHEVCLSTRMEASWGTSFGVFSNDGSTVFHEMEIFGRREE